LKISWGDRKRIRKAENKPGENVLKGGEGRVLKQGKQENPTLSGEGLMGVFFFPEGYKGA